MFWGAAFFFLPIGVSLAATREECRARGELYFSKDDLCLKALESPRSCRGDANQRMWIVRQEGNKTDIGLCVEKTCKEIDEACKKKLRRGPACSANQHLIFTEYGYTVCVCSPGYLETDPGVCHKPYTRGPCKWNQYLFPDPGQGYYPVCLRNRCRKGEAYIDVNKLMKKPGGNSTLPVKRECVRVDRMKCEDKAYMLTQDTLEPCCNCDPLAPTAAMGTVGALPCGRGQVRNPFGLCISKPRKFG